MFHDSKQQVGVLVSLAVHAWFLSLMFFLPALNPMPVKTFYINFISQQEESLAAPQPEKAQTTVRRQAEVVRPDSRRMADAPVDRKTAIPVDRSPAVSIPVKIVTPEPVASVGSSSKPSGPPVGQSGFAATGVKQKSGSVMDTRFGDVDAPQFIHRKLPVYPRFARSMEREGKVVLRLFIDHRGKLLNVTVLESAAYGFTEAAVEAIKKSTFAPARRNGEKVASKAILSIRFRLGTE